VVGKTAKVELECALDGVRASTGDARGVAPKARRWSSLKPWARLWVKSPIPWTVAVRDALWNTTDR